MLPLHEEALSLTMDIYEQGATGEALVAPEIIRLNVSEASWPMAVALDKVFWEERTYDRANRRAGTQREEIVRQKKEDKYGSSRPLEITDLVTQHVGTGPLWAPIRPASPARRDASAEGPAGGDLEPEQDRPREGDHGLHPPLADQPGGGGRLGLHPGARPSPSSSWIRRWCWQAPTRTPGGGARRVVSTCRGGRNEDCSWMLAPPGK